LYPIASSLNLNVFTVSSLVFGDPFRIFGYPQHRHLPSWAKSTSPLGPKLAHITLAIHRHGRSGAPTPGTKLWLPLLALIHFPPLPPIVLQRSPTTTERGRRSCVGPRCGGTPTHEKDGCNSLWPLLPLLVRVGPGSRSSAAGAPRRASNVCGSSRRAGRWSSASPANLLSYSPSSHGSKENPMGLVGGVGQLYGDGGGSGC
jgi:hypothetical protein